MQTAVADDEVFHETVPGHFWYFLYPVIDPKPGEPKHVMIATTRPETMLGDTAVAVHPDPAAALDRAEAELRQRRAAAPEKLKAELQAELDDVQRRRHELLPELLALRDMARDGRKVMLPLLNRSIPLIADEWAKPELGTGAVKITPAHDPNDYDVGLRQGLPMVNILEFDGTLSANAGPYRGQTVMVARQNVAADLEKLGLVAKVEDRAIDLAHSDRSKTPIEPLLADQWFVKMEGLSQMAMDAVTEGRVKIIPGRYSKGYLDWLSEKRDWPISRQLWWGHQIPVWHGRIPLEELDAQTRERLQRLREGQQQSLAAAAPEHLAELRRRKDEFYGETHPAPYRFLKEKYGENVSVQFRPEEELQGISVFVCVRPGCQWIEKELEETHRFQRDEGVLDTWFSSALWPHSTLGWPENTPELAYYYPTSVLITNRDIITLWVARMVLTGLHNMGEVPFYEVYIHSKILDAYGEGMSKSKGNGVDPVDLIEKFGADSLRFGLAYLATETQDIRMPVEFECPHCEALIEQTKENRTWPRVKCSRCGKDFGTQWAEKPADKALPRGAVVSERFAVARNFCNKLWNASRFALMNLEGYAPAGVPEKDLLVEDRWILSRLSTVTQQVTDALAAYQYADAARFLYEFAWDEFCSFYVEMVKGRLQTAGTRPTAQRVLAHVLDALLRLLHPMMPFLTEEVWHLLGQVAPRRGLSDPGRVPSGCGPEEPREAAQSVMIAPWPESEPARRDAQIEARFARFQEVLRAVREVRSRQNVPPKKQIEFAVRCDAQNAALLRPWSRTSSRWRGRGPRAGARRSRPRRFRLIRRCREWNSSSTWRT